MPHPTPEGLTKLVWDRGKGQGLFLQVVVAHSLFWCQGSGSLKSSDAEGKVTAASSGELSVMVTTTKYSPVLACITTDCEGRSGPGLVWRMPEVCG